MTEDKPVAWEVEFGNGEVELWSVKDHPSEPAFGEIVTALYAQSYSAVRVAAIAECARVGRNLYKSDGGRLNAYDEGWNDGVEAAERAIRALSPRPTVSEAWINKVIEDADMKQTPWTAGTAIRAALQSLGYEVTK